jgi:flavin-binding protein dodecin
VAGALDDDLDVVEVAGVVDVPVAVEDGAVWPFRVKRPGRYGRRS